jgi:hypothetical protein
MRANLERVEVEKNEKHYELNVQRTIENHSYVSEYFVKVKLEFSQSQRLRSSSSVAECLIFSRNSHQNFTSKMGASDEVGAQTKPENAAIENVVRVAGTPAPLCAMILPSDSKRPADGRASNTEKKSNLTSITTNSLSNARSDAGTKSNTTNTDISASGASASGNSVNTNSSSTSRTAEAQLYLDFHSSFIDAICMGRKVATTRVSGPKDTDTFSTLTAEKGESEFFVLKVARWRRRRVRASELTFVEVGRWLCRRIGTEKGSTTSECCQVL